MGYMFCFMFYFMGVHCFPVGLVKAESDSIVRSVETGLRR